ncbi:MAG: NYN domain-containing protein [Bacteroides sp.]|nr:NYN domain-containing protein [Ruminococcus flavefaciens]MCM1554483.1 NYN domain-containing protein [Bacteroides sp.]
MNTRVTFYVDGFNFYYGLRRMSRVDKKWHRYYWLDVVKFFKQFIGAGQELSKVVYFTASPLDPVKSGKQSAFLNANKLRNPDKFEVVRGKYINKTIKCPHCKVSINRPEEKKTDVNLSVRMMGDCFKNETDVVVLVSADTDLIPPIDFILKNFSDKRVKVYFPPSNSSFDINEYMKAHKSDIVKLEFNERKFSNAIMPDIVTDGSKSYTVPENWK